MKTKKRLSKPAKETRLERAVRRWLNDKGRDYDNGWQGALKDLLYGGCESGIVSGLIYYQDTRKFYQQNREEIAARLTEAFENCGFYDPVKLFGDKWDETDPLAFNETNQNLLAWFGFEETARLIEGRAELDNAA